MESDLLEMCIRDRANTIGGETWCTVTPANGKAGEGGFTVNIVENKGYDDRNVTITLTVGDVYKRQALIGFFVRSRYTLTISFSSQSS